MTDPTIGDNWELSIDAKTLQDALRELDGTQDAIKEATGEHRAAIKRILDAHQWHKSALATIRQIAAMSPTKRADYLRTFLPMLRVLMDAGWREEAIDMLDGDGEDGEQAE